MLESLECTRWSGSPWLRGRALAAVGRRRRTMQRAWVACTAEVALFLARPLGTRGPLCLQSEPVVSRWFRGWDVTGPSPLFPKAQTLAGLGTGARGGPRQRQGLVGYNPHTSINCQAALGRRRLFHVICVTASIDHWIFERTVARTSRDTDERSNQDLLMKAGGVRTQAGCAVQG